MVNAPSLPATSLCKHARTFFCSGRRFARPWAVAVLSVAWILIVGLGSAQASQSLGLGIEASLTADDNVTRGYGDGNVLSDQFLGVNFSKHLLYPLYTRARVALQGFAGLNGYFEYAGLSHYYAGLQGQAIKNFIK